jgi:AcrR family transcriptional regulator
MPYDSQATRERILAAATTEFAAHGVAGARIDRIAAAAGANKRAIYDYFGDKDALFAAVLERELSDCAEAVPVEGGDLGDYAGRLLEYHAARPQALRLLLWEALELTDQRPLAAEQVRVGKYARRAEAVAATDQLPAEDARLLLFLTIGLVNWGAAVPQLRRMILGDGYPADRYRQAVAGAVRALAEGVTRPVRPGGG